VATRHSFIVVNHEKLARTHPLPPIDALVDERGTVKAGPGDHIVSPCKNGADFRVIDTVN